jgi:hypothetical protein
MSSGNAYLDGVSVTENITKERHYLMTSLHLLSVLNIVCLTLVIYL